MQVFEFIGKKKEYLKAYRMDLNENRAKNFRENKSKDIEFFNLQYRLYYDYLNLSSLNHNDKSIYEFEKFPILDKGVDSRIITLTGKYGFFKCKYIGNNFLEKQQNNFLEEYVSQGLSSYDFSHLESSINGTCAGFIFLNPIESVKNIVSICHSDNVVYLPNEILVSYLLENGLFKEIEKHLVKENEYQKIIDCFDFEVSSVFSENQITDLTNEGIIDQSVLTRRIEQNKNIINYIPKR